MNDLLSGYTVASPARTIRGRAKSYLPRYVRSFNNLLERMGAAGLVVERIPGPRGGEWCATYKLKE